MALPEQPISPPEMDDETYNRNCRNMCRADAIVALGTVISRLDEAERWREYFHDKKYLESLIERLNRDMED
jgi:hypothetical protein